jgi:DNA replication protein DnaC
MVPRLVRLLTLDPLRYATCVEHVKIRATRGLERSRLLHLAVGEWIRPPCACPISGPIGTGTSWLACALGNSACRKGRSVS